MSILETIDRLPLGPLEEESLRQYVFPLFSRVLNAFPDEIYLANHSLGRPLDKTAQDVAEALDLWYTRLDGAWSDDAWPAALERFRSQIASLIGARDGNAVVPKTSAGQGLRAVLNALPSNDPKRGLNVVATRGEFDSLDFILKTYASKGRVEVSWVEADPKSNEIPVFTPNSIIGKIENGTDLIVVSQIAFSTGHILPEMDRIVRAAHSAGATILVDAYHAAGVIPLHMEESGIDFMVGGSYKYTRGGPGACWLALHSRHLESGLQTLDTGWFAKRNPFSYERADTPEFGFGGDAWLESTPPVLTYYQAAAGLELTLAIGVERLREYNLRQVQFLRSRMRDQGVACHQPANPFEFGAFALVPCPNPGEFCRRLKYEGVNADHRGGAVRFGPDLLTTDSELERAAEITGRMWAESV
jgi:kynureninase